MIKLVVREGLRMGISFVKSGFTVSAKSVVNASSKELACRTTRALTHAGQMIAAVNAADDLGIRSGCGARRAASALKKRLFRGGARAKRIQQLVRAHRSDSELLRRRAATAAIRRVQSRSVPRPKCANYDARQSEQWQALASNLAPRAFWLGDWVSPNRSGQVVDEVVGASNGTSA